MLQNSEIASTQIVSSDLEKRRKLGIYYTPNSVATLLVEWAIHSAKDTVLEPSFGGCSLLTAAIDQLHRLGASDPASQISGFDVDPQALQCLHSLVPNDRHRSNFVLADFLMATPAKRFDVVIANPPFVAYHQCDLGQRAILKKWRQTSSTTIPGTSSIWAYFLLHALSFLNEKGRLAFILPQAALTADYAVPIWNHVRTHFQTITVVKLAGPVFAAAGTNTRVIILLGQQYLRQGHSRRVEVRTVAMTHADDLNIETISRNDSASTPDTPTDSSAQALIETLRSRGHIQFLGQRVRAQIGEVIGDRKFFVRSAKQWRTLDLPTRFTRPLLTRSSALTGIQLLPSDVVDDSDFPRALVTNRLDHPAVREVVCAYSDEKRDSNVTFAKRDPWYHVPYDSTAAAFIPSLSHLAPRIVLNRAAISCSNVFYKLVARPPAKWSPVLAIASVTTLFQVSAELTARLRGIGGLKLEPKDVHKLLVPTTIDQLAQDRVARTIQVVDRYLRLGNFIAATCAADQFLLRDSKAIDARTLETLKGILRKLRSERLSGTA